MDVWCEVSVVATKAATELGIELNNETFVHVPSCSLFFFPPSLH